MVDKNDCNEVAVLFSAKEVEMSGKNLTVLIPRKVVVGYYDNYDNIFIDVDDVVYNHVFVGDVGCTFGKRMTILNLLSKYKNCCLKDAKKKYLEDIKKHIYYYDPDASDYSAESIKEIDKVSGKISNFKDLDIDYFRSLYCEAFDSALNGIVKSSPPSFVIPEQSPLSTNSTVESKQSTINAKYLYDELSKKVIGQQQAHRKILTTITKNYNRKDKSQNIFVIGPTGVGKTETFQTLSKLMNVPFIIEDCNEFTVSGYKGRDVYEIITDLIKAANNDFEAASRGIVVLDEVDKLAQNEGEYGIASSGVQLSLLTMLEGYDYYISGKKFNTKGITFVAAGAFTNMENLISHKAIGFEQESFDKSYSNIELADLEKYGMTSEFLGRFSSLVMMRGLDIKDYIDILKSEVSPFLEWKKDFDSIGVRLIYDENDLYYEIAKKAKEYNKGARGLNMVINDMIYEAYSEINFSSENYGELVIGAQTVTNPKKYVLRK